MKRIIFTVIFCLMTGTAFASLLINGNLIIKINFGQTSSTVAAILQEDGSKILQEDGGVLLYD